MSHTQTQNPMDFRALSAGQLRLAFWHLIDLSWEDGALVDDAEAMFAMGLPEEEMDFGEDLA